MNDVSGCLLSVFGWVLGALCFVAWLTHVVICFQENHWGFLIAGAIFFPIGIVHGVGRWFLWW